MGDSDTRLRCEVRFAEQFGLNPMQTASAPGRLEVLGNHTDYNFGRTLSCAVDLRCYASIAALDRPEVHLSSTAFDAAPEVYPLDPPSAPAGHWTNYVLGLVAALRQRGHAVPGFAIHFDSQVPGSAGLSSSAALEMSALNAITRLIDLDLPPIEMAAIGQRVESDIIGAKTGLLDQFTSLLGKRGYLLGIDFKTLETQQLRIPAGWCFVAVDSGVKHDLTQEYNQRRATCEKAADAMGVTSLREAAQDRLAKHADAMGEDAWRCARHVLSENARVGQAQHALNDGDIEALGTLMFQSHASSKHDFRNSCEELDTLVAYAQHDPRCIGARLSGGGFGGITIHLVRESDAHRYLEDVLASIQQASGQKRWGAVCRIDDGARVE